MFRPSRSSRSSAPTEESIHAIFCGTLEKQPFHTSFGGMFSFGGTKQRYCVLCDSNKGSLLRYYKNEGAYKENPNSFRNQVVLTSASTVIVDEDSDGRGFWLSIDVSAQLASNCKSELYFKSVAGAEDASAWVAALRRCIGTLVDGKAQIVRTLPRTDLPFDENSIDELLFAIWTGNFARVEAIVSHFPWLLTERGNVFEKRLHEAGYARVKESTLPLVAAMERQNADMTKILLRAGAKAEAERASMAFAGSINTSEKASFVGVYRPGVARASLAVGSSGFQDQTRQSIFGGDGGQLRASLGFHPNRIDKKFRESLFEMKLEAAKSGWKPMNKLDLKYIDIMVDRCGDTPDAFMVTRSIVREIERHISYRIFTDVTGKPHLVPNEQRLETLQEEDAEKETVADSGEGMYTSPISAALAPSKASRRLSRQEVHIKAKAEQDALLEQDSKVVTAIHSLFPTSADHGGDSSSSSSSSSNSHSSCSSKAQPLVIETERVKFLQVHYDWRVDEEVEDANGNIFGKNSVLVVDTDVLRVPCNIATKENVAFFNAVLLEPGGTLEFELPDDLERLPLTLMDVGKDYVEHFIMKSPEGGVGIGGAYLEWHNVPHFHMPLRADCGGYLVLGIMDEASNMFRLAGFRIPFGKAIYMKPFTIHNDCFLIGEFECVYASTDDFCTGTVVNQNCESCSFEFF